MKENIVEFPDRGALQSEAAMWLVRLDGDDEPTEEMLAALREWLARSPAHREELYNLAATWSSMNVLTELAVPLGRVEPRREFLAPIKAVRSLFAHAASRAVLASILLVTLVYSAVVLWPQPAPYLASNGAYTTRIGEQETVTLADGSVILLNTNSEVVVDYSREFRNIRLTRGEVEFQVAKNPTVPFRVYAGNERVQAIGTAFTVYIQEEKIDVTVTEGQVALATLNQPNIASAPAAAPAAVPNTSNAAVSSANANQYVETLSSLRAGQSASMNIVAGAAASQLSAIETIEVINEQDLERRLSWREGLLVFAGEPLEDVVREISRYTNITIVINDPQVRAIKIGGQFPVGQTEDMFDSLEANFPVRVTRLGQDRVLLSAAEN